MIKIMNETERFYNKKIKKRYSSLEKDMEVYIKNIIFSYHTQGIDTLSIFTPSHLVNSRKENFKTYKGKKFRCKSLKGKGTYSGIRLIYTYFPQMINLTQIENEFKSL